jgi:hypothetical protein
MDLGLTTGRHIPTTKETTTEATNSWISTVQQAICQRKEF